MRGLTYEQQQTTTFYSREGPGGPRRLAGKEAVSALADELGVQPSQIHTWVNQVLAQAERAFEKSQRNGRERTDQAKDRRIEQLQAKIADKNEVIAELMEANVRAKKVLGEL